MSTRMSWRPKRNWSPFSTKVGTARRRKVPLEEPTSRMVSFSEEAEMMACRPEMKLSLMK